MSDANYKIEEYGLTPTEYYSSLETMVTGAFIKDAYDKQFKISPDANSTEIERHQQQLNEMIGLPADYEPVTLAQLTQMPVIETIISDDANEDYKHILPELALLKLRESFDDIHDEAHGDAITKGELQDYAKRTDLSGLERVSIDYAIRNLRKLDNLDPLKDGFTLSDLNAAINILSGHELDVALLDQAHKKVSPAVNALANNYEAIQPDPLQSIKAADLQKCIDEGCADENAISEILLNYRYLSNQDRADGDLKPNGFERLNNAGLTRSDAENGIAFMLKMRELQKSQQETIDYFSN